MAHKSQMKDLDKKAAKIISRENTMHLAIRRGTRVVLNLCRAGSKRKERSTFTVFMSWKPSSTQRSDSNPQLIGTTTRSASCWYVLLVFKRALYYMHLMRYALVPLPGRGLHSDGG